MTLHNLPGPTRKRTTHRRMLLACGLIMLTAACARKSDSAGDTATAGAASAGTAAAPHDSGAMAGMTHDSMAMGGMAGMSGMMPAEDRAQMQMTGDADRDFLRMMSDHHKGLIAMAHLTVEEKKGSAAAQADARKLDKKQDAELDSMMTKLEQQYKDAYAPKVMPSNQKMVDDLKGLSGAAFDSTFYHHVIMHHQQAIGMIDELLPKMKDAKVKAMAERMKQDQTKEIQEFQPKAKKG